jgi:hypothetical protein
MHRRCKCGRRRLKFDANRCYSGSIDRAKNENRRANLMMRCGWRKRRRRRLKAFVVRLERTNQRTHGQPTHHRVAFRRQRHLYRCSWRRSTVVVAAAVASMTSTSNSIIREETKRKKPDSGKREDADLGVRVLLLRRRQVVRGVRRRVGRRRRNR